MSVASALLSVISILPAQAPVTGGFENTVSSQVTTNPLSWPASVFGGGSTGLASVDSFTRTRDGESLVSGAIAENSLTPPASLFVAPRTGLRAFYALPGREVFQNALPFPVSIGQMSPVSNWRSGSPGAPLLQSLTLYLFLPGDTATRRFAARIFDNVAGASTNDLWWIDPLTRTIPRQPTFYREFTVPTNTWTQIDLSTPFGQIFRWQLFGLTDTGEFDPRPYAIDDITAAVPAPSAAAVLGLGTMLAMRRRRA